MASEGEIPRNKMFIPMNSYILEISESRVFLFRFTIEVSLSYQSAAAACRPIMIKLIANYVTP